MAAANHPGPRADLDALVVGAGFGGMYALHRLRSIGLETLAVEAGTDVGGTWYWNRYPGARCDVDSLEYSYSFSAELEQEWEWTERYPSQPEILRYARHVADRFDLRPSIRFGTRVAAAVFDEEAARWRVSTDDGDQLTTRFLVMATGCLSAANLPAIVGMDEFAGPLYHSARWPEEAVDLADKRVGVVGTGSSGIQLIPVVAEEAGHLYVFQRTANYSIPARNRPLDPAEQAAVKAEYPEFRARLRKLSGALGASARWNRTSALSVEPDELERELEARWAAGGLTFLGAFGDTTVDPAANALVADFVRAKIRSIVSDPAVAELLCPTQVIGCKRLCLDTGYYETFNRQNVTLVDISRSPIERLTPGGLATGGREYELDCLVFATGFDAMTGSLTRIDVRGRGGVALGPAWSAGPLTYLGLGVPGFPNLFIVTGPGSPSVLANMITGVEHHVDWIAGCIQFLDAHDYSWVEPEPAAAEAWVSHVNEVASGTLLPTCNSWYVGANVPGKPRVFMPLIGFPPYVKRCAEVAANGYEGFALGR